MIHHTLPGEVFFKPFRIRLLKKIHDCPKDSELTAEDVPNRTVQILDNEGRILKSAAIEGKDFVRI